MHDFDSLYDADELRAMDEAAERLRNPPPQRRTVRRSGAGAALTISILNGINEALDDHPDEPVEEPEVAIPNRTQKWVTYVHVPGSPHQSYALVKPWLAPSAAIAGTL